MVKIATHLLLFLFLPLAVFAANNNVLSFSPMEYGGARQNWCVSSAGGGNIFFANHSGLLSFDGTNWALNNLPDNTNMRSVLSVGDSIVYSGGYEEMGYWKTDRFGRLRYTSLDSMAGENLKDNDEFWNIAAKNDYVYFQAFPKILYYHADSISRVAFKNQDHIFVMASINGKVLVAVRNQGIFSLENGSPVPFITDKTLEKKEIKFLLPYKEDQLLIGTADDGILLWNGTELKNWNETWTDYFRQNELNRACLLGTDRIVIGTLVDGIAVFDLNGNLSEKINTENGLSSNTILGLETDEWGNIWVALDNGICFFSTNRKTGFQIEPLPGTGAIYATAIFRDKTYFGTNQGLFVKDTGGTLGLVPGLQDQIWDLAVVDDQLLVGHNQGTYVITDDKPRLISGETGAFNFLPDPKNPNLLLQSTYNNIVVFRKNNNGIIDSYPLAGFFNLLRYIQFDHVGNLWASHMHRGVFKLTVDDERKNITAKEYFGKETFGKENSIHVFLIENRVVFTTEQQLYTYDDLKDSIVPYETLNKKLGIYKASHRIIAAPDHHYWMIKKGMIALFLIEGDEIKLIREFPSALFDKQMLVEGFENLLPLNEYSGILCLQNGIAYLDASIANSSSELTARYRPQIRKVELKNNPGKMLVLPPDTNFVSIRHNFNNLALSASFPLMSDLPVSYTYLLKGLNDQWSKKTDRPEFSFQRLPKGSYEFRVKAIDLWGNESKVCSFNFEIRPPLILSNGALAIYAFLLLAALLLFRARIISQTRKKEHFQHEIREKELIRLRNEKLRSEIQHKSKELANSTMAIKKKNEFLLNLKQIVLKQKTELGSRFPDKYFNYLNTKIDENISSRDDQQIFVNNFERAHEQFFIKMKEQYPDLTSSDLQLCAYLRMNLSTKEIAPLLGISVRGVENHRYRLRKKMGMEHDASLTDMILGI